MYLPHTILIVSFDPQRMNACWRLFLERSYFVVTARNVDSACEVIRHGRYDLLIVGSSVPSAAREIVSLEFRSSQPRQPVLWITAGPQRHHPLADGLVRYGDDALLVRSAEFLMGHVHRTARAA